MNGGERGFTVIEMLVAVTLTSIVGAMATTVIVQGFHQQAATDARAAAVANVRTALGRTVREVREASLNYLTADSLGMSDGTRTLNYSLQTANGVTSLVVNDGTATSVVVGHLVNDMANPVFGAERAPLTPAPPASVDSQTCAVVGAVPAIYSTQDCVGTVRIHLRVMPTNAAGNALCNPTDNCVIDVYDDADLRNVT
jgi:prepilin-type N-terminal cleavage/methylation domain-containing protein